jgi:hypothetical protein
MMVIAISRSVHSNGSAEQVGKRDAPGPEVLNANG